MSSFQQALAFQELLEQVGEQVKDNQHGRAYLSPDGRAYVLALGGDRAKQMQDFMTAVGQYLLKVRHGRGDATAKADLLRAFEEWLSGQEL
jgi:hypothetical protein